MAQEQRKIFDKDIISHVNDYGVDVENREIFLFPNENDSRDVDVEYGMGNKFIKNLRLLVNANRRSPILIHLKSEGGEWVEGLAIYQAIVSCPCPTIMLNYACAQSMSSIIFSAATKRVMMPYSTFMVHTGINHIVGTGTQVQTEYEETLKADRIMFDIYVGKLREAEQFEGWTDKKIENWLRKLMKEKEEVYFTAEEALEHNFADEIFGFDGKYDWNKLTKINNRK